MRFLLALIVAVGLVTPAMAAENGGIESGIKTMKVERGLTPEAQKCVQCHADKMPGIVADWTNSRHGHVGVSCIDCHRVEKGSVMAAQNCPGVSAVS